MAYLSLGFSYIHAFPIRALSRGTVAPTSRSHAWPHPPASEQKGDIALMSYSTATLPLTTIFTPPASCSSHWTYEASYYNSISGGLLLQNAEKENLDVACFPSGFAGYGRAPSFIQVYSPGACPSGYTTPAVFYNSGTTTAVCCQK